MKTPPREIVLHVELSAGQLTEMVAVELIRGRPSGKMQHFRIPAGLAARDGALLAMGNALETFIGAAPLLTFEDPLTDGVGALGQINIALQRAGRRALGIPGGRVNAWSLACEVYGDGHAHRAVMLSTFGLDPAAYEARHGAAPGRAFLTAAIACNIRHAWRLRFGKPPIDPYMGLTIAPRGPKLR